MKILIAGNLGYVGPVAVRTLRTSYPRATLVGLDTGYFADCLTTVRGDRGPQVDVQYDCDLRQVTDEQLRNVDAVVNLAALSNDVMGSIDESLTLAVNHRACVRLAQKAKKYGATSFVFASSCSVYGAGGNSPRTEDSPVDPLTAYARSKILAEHDLKLLADDEFKVTCLRFATACGMSERLRLDLVLNDFVACAVTSNTVDILSDGTPWRPLIHVADMARAIDWAIQRPLAPSGPYLTVNTGSNQWNYRVKDLARAVTEAIPGVEVTLKGDGGPDRRSYRVNFNLFEQLAGKYQPKVTLAAAISGLAEQLASIGFQDRQFRQSELIRLNVLHRLMAEGKVTDQLYWNVARAVGAVR